MMSQKFSERQEEFRKKHGFYLKDLLKYQIVLFAIILIVPRDKSPRVARGR